MGPDDYTAEERSYFETRGGENEPATTTATTATPAPAAPAAGAAAGADPAAAGAGAPAAGAAAGGDAGTAGAPAGAGAATPPAPAHVPLAELMEERTRYKDARTEADRLRQQNEVLMTRTSQILEQLNRAQPVVAQPAAAATPAAPAVPDINVEPLKYIQYMLEEQGKRIDATTQQVQARTQQEQQQQLRTSVEQTIRNEASRQEAEFKAATPDYDKAITHLITARNAQMVALGVPPEQRNAMIQNETLAIAARAIETGQNPAALAYQLARSVGYAPVAAAAGAAAPAAGGAVAAAAPGAAPAPTDAEKLAMVAAGQRENRPGVGTTTGQASPPLTVDAMLEMDDVEFAKVIKTTAGRALMGQ